MKNELPIISKNNFFNKIKSFFYKHFHNEPENMIVINDKLEEPATKSHIIKNIANNEILELQKLYRKNELNVQELTSEQVLMMCDVYDKQISTLRSLNESKKKKILKYKEKLQVNN